MKIPKQLTFIFTPTDYSCRHAHIHRLHIFAHLHACRLRPTKYFFANYFIIIIVIHYLTLVLNICRNEEFVKITCLSLQINPELKIIFRKLCLQRNSANLLGIRGTH